MGHYFDILRCGAYFGPKIWQTRFSYPMARGIYAKYFTDNYSLDIGGIDSAPGKCCNLLNVVISYFCVVFCSLYKDTQRDKLFAFKTFFKTLLNCLNILAF